MPHINEDLTLVPPMAEYDFDLDEAAVWVQQEMDAKVAETLEEYDRQAAFEADMNAPIAEHYQTLGFHPDMVDQARLDAHFQEQVRLRDGIIKESDDLGVLRQPLPVPAGTRCRQKKSKPYAIGHPLASADRSTGRFALLADGPGKRDTGKIGTVFQVQTGGTDIRADMALFNHGPSGLAWGFFGNTHLRLDLHFFIFNVTSGKVFSLNRNIYHYDNWWAGVVGIKQMPLFSSATVSGKASKGDRIIVSASITASVTSPALGSGKIDYSGDLLSLCIDR